MDFKQENVANEGVYLDRRQKSQGHRDPPQSEFKPKGKHARPVTATSGFTGSVGPGAGVYGPW